MKKLFLSPICCLVLFGISCVLAQDVSVPAEEEIPKVSAEETSQPEETSEEETKPDRVDELFDAPEEDGETAEEIVIEADEIPEESRPRDVPAAEPAEGAAPAEVPALAPPSAPEPAPVQTPTAAPAAAQTPAETPLTTEALNVQAKKDLHIAEMHRQMTGPRAVVKFFLEKATEYNYEDALLAMDFSNTPEMPYVEKQELAFQLLAIFMRLDNFRLSRIPETYPKNECYLWPDKKFNALVLTRQPDDTWRIGAATIAGIPEFYEKISSKAPTFTQRSWMRYLPDWMFLDFFGLAMVQWVIFLLFFVVSIFVCKILPKLFAAILLLVLKFARGHKEYAPFLQRALRPIAYLTMVYIWYGGLAFVQASPRFLSHAGLMIHPLGVFLVMLTLLRFVDVFAIWFRRKVKAAANKVGHILVDFVVAILKFLIICLGVVGIVQIFGFSAVGILSGMGIGGIAVALAAQQTISNFFGSLAILMDKPFTVGDHVIIGAVEGVVEAVGVRSTKIRTFYDSCVYIPNSSLADTTIDNMGKRLYRRFKTVLRLRYDTPAEKLAAFTRGIYEILKKIPGVVEGRSDVAVYDFSEYSIDIQLVCFLQVTTSQAENARREEVILPILELAKELDISFAVPVSLLAG